ncbi:tetratricopeptide repeat protein [Catellatospora bangladeshensis]|uniref:tetratricopeptide repeat protein n=1 Tax=Catellatospora bangladeshensis TaxID=310355 RepID=UPI0036133A03
MGWAHARLGQYGPALDHCRRALVLLRQTDDRHGEANTWDSLGFIHDRLGRYRRAVSCYHRALILFTQIGDRFDEADTLNRLGHSRWSLGDRAGAVRTWQRALRIFDDLGHPDAEGCATGWSTPPGLRRGRRVPDRTPDDDESGLTAGRGRPSMAVCTAGNAFV